MPSTKTKMKKLTGLAQYVILSGWVGTLIYIYVSYEAQGVNEFLKLFLSTDSSGIRFRALILFVPFLTMTVGYLVNEREKFMHTILVSEDELRHKNEELMAFNERLTALRSIEMAISTSIDLQATLKIFTDKIVKQLSVDAVDVLLNVSETNTLVFSSDKGFITDDVGCDSIAPGEGFAGQIALSLDKLFIPDLTKHIDASGGIDSIDERDAYMYNEEQIRSYFGVPLISDNKFLGVLELYNRDAFEPSEEWQNFLENFTAQASIAINKASLFNELQDSNTELVKAYDTTIEGWARALDYRDKETEGHSRRVTDLTVELAMKMGIDGDELLHIRRGALLHDIGKMGVPDRILLKPGKFEPDERAIIERHPDIAFNLLSPIPFLKATIDIPYCHHERWDGTGYPRGLKGKEIPRSARIFAIVDVWDALRSDRPYRKAWSAEKTLQHIKSGSATHFDPEALDIFIKHITETVQIIPDISS